MSYVGPMMVDVPDRKHLPVAMPGDPDAIHADDLGVRDVPGAVLAHPQMVAAISPSGARVDVPLVVTSPKGTQPYTYQVDVANLPPLPDGWAWLEPGWTFADAIKVG